MNKGQLIKTRDVPNNVTDYFFIYEKLGGTKLSASMPENFVMGTYESEGNWLFQKYLNVKLATPMTLGGKVYTNVWIRNDYVFAYSPTLQNVYVKAGTKALNIRQTPFLTGKVLGTAKGSALIGQTDGTKRNGFYLVRTGPTQLGWVSANYVTIRAVASTTSTTPAPDKPVTIPAAGAGDLPVDDSTALEKADTTLDNALGDKVAYYAKFALAGLLALVVGLLVYRLAKNSHGTTRASAQLVTPKRRR